MLGAKSIHFQECFTNNFIGADFGIEEDLKDSLVDNWRDFNNKFIPIWMNKFPDKTKVAAGLSCGALWTISKGLKIGDIVLCPNGLGSYYVGEVISDYYYNQGGVLPHRRNVKWLPIEIERSQMSESLKNSTGSIGTVSNVTKYSDELETFINGKKDKIQINNDLVDNPTEFIFEKHLEDFLVNNWNNTDLSKDYDIYEVDNEIVGQQFPTDTGPIDILAISKDKKTLLIIELKKGRVSDNVVGQIQRYMGYVLEELAEPNQTVKGIIIGFEDDIKIRRALAVACNIEFYRYHINFKLYKS